MIFERPDAEPGSINHLGVETESADEVVAAESRITAAGLTTSGIDDTICCFAEKVETWVQGPQGHKWEWYVKQADHETQLDNVILNHEDTSTCCAPEAADAAAEAACCAPVPASLATGSCC